MKKEIQYSSKSVKYLGKLAKNVRVNITNKIDTLAENPSELANNITKLQGFKDLYRLRVGNYRIIYTNKMTILYIETIGHRGNIY